MAKNKKDKAILSSNRIPISPVREQKKDISFKKKKNDLVNALKAKNPDLRKKLKLAAIDKKPTEFLEQIVNSSLLFALPFSIFSTLLIYNYDLFEINIGEINISLFILVPILYVIFSFIFFKYFMLYPDVKRIKRIKDIDYEIVFAGRHLLIALRSGLPLFDAFLGLTNDYGEVSKEFRKIVEVVTLGTPLSQAMKEVALNNPSEAFQRIILQMVNAMSSGSDVVTSLETVLDQVSKEQIIELKTYGQKLNPIVMFFMIVGIIFPSLVMAFIIIFLSVLGIGEGMFNETTLIFIVFGIGLIQFLFLAFIESFRPRYSITE